MKTIGIVAEFNPFHKGHLHLIEHCKKALEADRVVVIMSGDYVQRGAPSIMDKFTRAKMALSCGADIVLELPIYYSLGSAEYFAGGAVSILDSLGCIDYLCFGSESGDITLMRQISQVLADEPKEFKTALSKELKDGQSFAKARQNALVSVLCKGNENSDIDSLLSSPNNILAIEYIKALIVRNSKIVPFTAKRVGEGYNSTQISEFSSATAIRNYLLTAVTDRCLTKKDIFKDDLQIITTSLPDICTEFIESYPHNFADTDSFSQLLFYKLMLEKNSGYSKYLDITDDLSNKIISALDDFSSFDNLCSYLKSKEIAYSRISRALFHVLLNITSEKMSLFKEDNYTGYARILGARKASSDLIKTMRSSSAVPVIGNLKEANTLSGLQKELFDSTLLSSSIYTGLFFKNSVNEFRQPLILM